MREDQPVDCFLDEDEGNPYFTYDYYCDRGKIKAYIEKSEFGDIWKIYGFYERRGKL